MAGAGQVHLKLFNPAPSKRRTVLLFLFRDRTRTPLERLAETWEGDLQQIWAALAKPDGYEQYTLTDFFEARLAAARLAARHRCSPAHSVGRTLHPAQMAAGRDHQPPGADQPAMAQRTLNCLPVCTTLNCLPVCTATALQPLPALCPQPGQQAEG